MTPFGDLAKRARRGLNPVLRTGDATIRRALDLELTDRAATLAFYSFLSLFPGLIVAISLLAILGTYPETYNDIIAALREAAPGTAVEAIDSALRDVLRGGSAGQLLGVGLLSALFTASGATGAAIRALEHIDPGADSRAVVKTTLARLGLTLTLVLLVVVAFIALLLAGPVFSSISDAAGLGGGAQTAVSLLRWPIGLTALLAAILILYVFGPGNASRTLTDHLPGALLAAALAIIASVLLSFYAANFGSYDATYGTLGAVIVLLSWLYVGNLALLLGACLNAELRKPRRKGAGR